MKKPFLTTVLLAILFSTNAQKVSCANQVRLIQVNRVNAKEVTLTGQFINQYAGIKQTTPANRVKVLLLYGNNSNDAIIDRLVAGSDVSNIDLQCRAYGMNTLVSYTDAAGNYTFSQVPKNTTVYILVFQNKLKFRVAIPEGGSNYVSVAAQYLSM